MISLERKTNFFESRVSEYALADKSGKEDAFSNDAFSSESDICF